MLVDQAASYSLYKTMCKYLTKIPDDWQLSILVYQATSEAKSNETSKLKPKFLSIRNPQNSVHEACLIGGEGFVENNL